MTWNYGDHHDFPTCPHCGTEYRDLVANLLAEVYDGYVVDVVCKGEDCGREYRVRIAVTWTYQSLEASNENQGGGR